MDNSSYPTSVGGTGLPHVTVIKTLIECLRYRAFEDGATLGALLGKIESKSQIPAVTKLYEKIRKERILRIRDETFRQQEEFHLPDGESQKSRDRHLAMSFNIQDSDEPW